MTHKLVYTKDYLLAVEDAKTGLSTFLLCSDVKYRWIFVDGVIQRITSIQPMNGVDLILAHRPLNNAAFLEGVDVLPSLEDDVEKLGIERAIERRWHPNSLETRRVANEIITAVSYGFNKAREKYKYTEEDIFDAINMSRNELDMSGNDIIQSLSQPKIPVGFECVMEYRDMVGYWYKLDEHSQSAVDRFGCRTRIKTITNSEERTEWVGKYVY